jgi:hypothetical protein
MVIEPNIRMGPPPRRLAAEANDCFMVRLPRGATEYKVAARSSRAMAGSPRIVGDQPGYRGSAAAPKATAPTADPAEWAIPNRYVTENRAYHKVANPPPASTPSATPNDRRDIARAARPSNRFPRSVTVGRRTDGPGLSAGATPSPSWSCCKPSLPPGTMRCPPACAIVPPPRRFRPWSISTSKSSSRSCHRAAMDAIEPQQNQGRTR